MVMTALPRSFLSIHTRETGQGLQFPKEDWVWIPLASQPDIIPPGGPLPQVGQVAPPQAGHPADDLPHKPGNPADPLDPPVHHTTPSYSAVAQIFPDSLAKPFDQPGSPGGWGAVDPTRAKSDSD